MQSGLDRIGAGLEPELSGKSVALLCNHTAVDRFGRHAADVLTNTPAVKVAKLLGPEHGIWSTHQDMEAVSEEGTPDRVFGIPTFSLYGAEVESLTPSTELLADVDVLIYDICDIGTRFYTYAATLAFAMETAAKVDTEVWVLDRPNPIGYSVEGPLLEPGFESFCGIEPGLPVRHGMTVGELARWYQVRRAPTCSLRVIPCDRNGKNVWVPPSPNMPTLDTAYVYPGMCLLEGTTLSEGRGTTTPFLLFGAPEIDPVRLCNTLQLFECPGVDFVPRIFRPEFGKHAGKRCGGAYIRVFDPTCVQGVALGVYCLEAVRRVAPEALTWRTDAYEFVEDVCAIDLLWGSPALRETLEGGGDVIALLKSAQASLEGFVR